MDKYSELLAELEKKRKLLVDYDLPRAQRLSETTVLGTRKNWNKKNLSRGINVAMRKEDRQERREQAVLNKIRNIDNEIAVVKSRRRDEA